MHIYAPVGKPRQPVVDPWLFSQLHSLFHLVGLLKHCDATPVAVSLFQSEC